MNQELRERTIFPILIPVAAIVLTEIIVFSMSRVLLATGKTAAVVIALGTAVAILLGASAIAAARRIRTSTIIGLLTVLLLGAVAAGAVAYERGPAYQREEAANIPTVEVAARNIAFDTKELKLTPAGTHIRFRNEDTQPHNIAIFADEAMTKNVFRGDIIQAGQTTTYNVGPLKPATYHFHCDVHPTMQGMAIVGAMSGGAHEGGHG